MSFRSNNILTKAPLWKHKKGSIFIGISILAIIISIAGIFILSANSADKIVSGKIYVNGEISNSVSDVIIIFQSGESITNVGIIDQGCYAIDVSDYMGESGTFLIIHNGEEFIPTDKSGNSINVVIFDDDSSYSIDLFIFTEEDDSSWHENESDDENEDQNDTDNSDDNSSDTNDDSSLDEPGEENDDGTNESDISDDTGDYNDNSSEDFSDSNSNNSKDGSSDSQNPSNIKVETLIWNAKQDALTEGIAVEIGEIVRFNVSVEYNGSFVVSYVNVLDTLPEGLEYEGNALVDGVNKEPIEDEINHTLFWNVSSFTNSHMMFIEFNCYVIKKGNHTNLINVTCKENTSTLLVSEDNTYVEVYGDLIVNKLIWCDELNAWAKNTTVDMGEIVRFNVSVEYDGSFILSDLNVLDTLPEGLEYEGNADVDGVNKEPIEDDINHTLFWTVSTLNSNQTVFIEFDVNVTNNETYVNSVRVSAKESIGKNFNKTSQAFVTGEAIEKVICSKKVKIQNSSWVDQIDGHVDDIASFNITISNVCNMTLYNIIIFDDLPKSLTYVDNSSIILFDNNTFQKEPDKDTENNFLMWANINQIIEDYLSPQENLSLVFDVIISKEGLAENTVNISSTLCIDCEPLAISDTAVINATIPTPQLLVSSGGPYYGCPGETMTFTAKTTGGVPPYKYRWDLDNDSHFDDGNLSKTLKQWDVEGNFTINVQVTDNESTIATNITFANIKILPLIVEAGGPYTTVVGETMEFIGNVDGGVADYKWHWDFGDGNTSTSQNPSHTYENIGTYVVTLTVIDGENEFKTGITQVTVKEKDIVPPIVEISKPINAIYINNKVVFPFFIPLVFGEIEICPTAADLESDLKQIDLYINEDLVHTFYSPSGYWTWDKMAFGRQVVKIIAYDTAGNSNTTELLLWKFF